jgi:hypothetical protein
MQEKGEYTHISYNIIIGECNIECWKIGEKGGGYNPISHNAQFHKSSISMNSYAINAKIKI